MKGSTSSPPPSAPPRQRAQAQPLHTAAPPPQQRAFAKAMSDAAPPSRADKRKSDDDAPPLTMTTARALHPGQAQVAPSSAGLTDTALAAQVERMAAAIAEVTAKGADAQFTLNMPLGSTKIEGAVLARDAAGRITISLIPATAIAPAQAAQMARQLTERLMKRDVKLGRVAFQPRASRPTKPA